MQKKSIILAVSLFAILIIGMFAFAYLNKKESIESVVKMVNQPEENLSNDQYSYIESVDAKVFHIDDQYTLVGEILMPTPCDLLVAESELNENLENTTNINFSIINNADVCAQVITPARFKVETTGNEEMAFKAYLAGREVRLNLVPAGAGETPDSYEIFIKG